MEKKTIGKFISALRRANGMTQKELGDKLYVSDKTVSRWERDECTPELSLVPALAEIFGITTDELLRGERNSAAGETTQHQKAKSDKQFKTMLHSRQTRFRNLSFISVSIALVGLILAVVVNLSFYKGILAFGIGAIFVLAAIVCQLCFASSAMLRRDEDDDSHDEQICRANSKTVETTCAVLIAMITIFAFILPLGLFGGGSHGLGNDSVFLLGSAYAAVALIAGYVLYALFIRRVLQRKGLILDARSEVRPLLKRTLAIALAIAVVLLGAYIGLGVVGPEVFDRQTVTFTDLEEFCTFTEEGALQTWKDTQMEAIVGSGGNAIAGEKYVSVDYGSDGTYDELIKAPVFETDQLRDADGKALCTYTSYSGHIWSIHCDVDEATGEVTVTVHTQEGMEQARRIYRNLQRIIELAMVLEILICAAVYLVKARKLRT